MYALALPYASRLPALASSCSSAQAGRPMMTRNWRWSRVLLANPVNATNQPPFSRLYGANLSDAAAAGVSKLPPQVKLAAELISPPEYMAHCG
jgi:hypothetical protein